MKKEIFRKGNSGITLIALVITVIVLLIISGVAIATLTGENGILNRAGEASSKTKRAAFIEQVQLDLLNAEVQANGNVSDETIVGVLANYFSAYVKSGASTGIVATQGNITSLSNIKGATSLTPDSSKRIRTIYA